MFLPFRRCDLLLKLATLCALLASSSASAATDDLVSAASDDHLWFVIEASPASHGFVLCHHASDMKGPYFGVQALLTQMPVKLAASGSQVWVAFDSGTTSNPKPEVYTIEVKRDPALGGYVSIPSDRMNIVPPLPVTGVVAAMAANSQGPAVLLVPPRPIPGLLSPRPPTTAPDAIRSPQLFQLQRGKWVAIELPLNLATGSSFRMVGDDARHGLTLMASAPENPEQSVRYDWFDDTWTETRIGLHMQSIRSLTAVGGQIAAVVESPISDQIEVECMRGSSLVGLAKFETPADRWTALGMSDRLVVLQRRDTGQLSMQTIDWLAGSTSQPEPLTVEPLSAGKLWQIAMFVAMVISGILLAFLVRPGGDKTGVAIPAGFEPLPLSLRMVAIVIDLFPSGLIAALIWKSSLTEMLTMPLFTINFEQSLPYLTMIGLTLLHSTVSEAIWSRSIGKALVGAKIARCDGSPPHPAQTIWRNALKSLALLIPPLGAVVLFNPNKQGLHDLAAGTVVIGTVENPDDANDQSA